MISKTTFPVMPTVQICLITFRYTCFLHQPRPSLNFPRCLHGTIHGVEQLSISHEVDNVAHNTLTRNFPR